MRKIKFRAWDRKRKQMLQVWKVSCGSFPHPSEFYNRDFDPFMDKSSDSILMQFTGLRDKNGKEIYEGDVLTHQSVVFNKENGYPKDNFQPKVIDGVLLQGVNQNPFPIHRNFENNPYRVVEYNQANFYPLMDYGAFELVVIGNIYENPELLKS